MIIKRDLKGGVNQVMQITGLKMETELSMTTRSKVSKEVVEQASQKVEQPLKLEDTPQTGSDKEQGNPTKKDKTFLKEIQELSKKLALGNNEMQVSMHEGTNKVMVKIIDKETKDVIKELPSEKLLDMIADMCEAAGLFVDEKR